VYRMSSSVCRFGEFELDPARFQLSRNGRPLKLERIPMELLIFLAERDGAVVTRQEIIERLWGKDVFVDTEHGINTAIRKIRQVLKDDPEHPRFVETVTGKGYRFIGQKIEAQTETAPSSAPHPKSPEPMWEQPPQPALNDPRNEGSRTGLPGGAEGSRRSDAATPTAHGSADHVRTTVCPPPTQSPQSKPLRVAAVVLLLLAAALAYSFLSRIFASTIFASTRASQIHSIAVIPLLNLSGDPDQEYFADNMTDELITMLAKNTTLRVVSRTSVMQYKSAQRPVRDIARELGVDGILEGSVNRSGNHVHMNVQLIYAPGDRHVWAESYDRDLGQAFQLPSDLSQAIAKQVQAKTSAAPATARYINPEAHDAYLHGRSFWLTHSVPDTLPYFQKAIELQPDYAAAWSGLSDTYALAGMTWDLRAREAGAKAESAARKALALDDSLADAHISMSAWLFFYGWDFTRADAECRRAIELDPNSSNAHYLYGSILQVMNHAAEGLAEVKRSIELEPFARSWGLGEYLIDDRKYDAAIAELTMQSKSGRYEDEVAFYLSQAYWLKGMYKESQRELERGYEINHDSKGLAEVHQVWLRGGERAVEQWGANSIKTLARKHYVPAYDIASTVAFTGDKNETLKYLETAYRDHSPNMVGLQTVPLFDFLHGEPRYQALVKAIGLPPAP
jgi:TolB-like protein/DNA-binding winged helix-turn-helix (wHTH) protein